MQCCRNTDIITHISDQNFAYCIVLRHINCLFSNIKFSTIKFVSEFATLQYNAVKVNFIFFYWNRAEMSSLLCGRGSSHLFIGTLSEAVDTCPLPGSLSKRINSKEQNINQAITSNE